MGLNIIRKREDNYHDLETVFFPLGFTDALEIIPSQNNQNEFTVTGSPLSNNENNLCLKAYRLLKNDFPELPFVKMHLHKVVPMGAGLGGGSANAAFTLKLLNNKFSLNIPDNKLAEYAFNLGSDSPFFIFNKPCFATGVGEVLQPVNIDLTSYKLLLVYPEIEISTAWAFSQIKPAMPKKSIFEIIKQPPESWQQELLNDFEVPAFQNYPQLQRIKNDLYEMGSVYASLTGSGSALYGLFKNGTSIQIPREFNFFCKIIALTNNY